VIPARCIEISTNEGEVVLDPFGGGGSTFEAAEQLKLYWIGTEIVDCELIRDRFQRNLPGVERVAPPQVLSDIFGRPHRNPTIDSPLCQESSKKSTMTEHASA
jgi:hypothetical protein